MDHKKRDYEYNYILTKIVDCHMILVNMVWTICYISNESHCSPTFDHGTLQDSKQRAPFSESDMS